MQWPRGQASWRPHGGMRALMLCWAAQLTAVNVTAARARPPTTTPAGRTVLGYHTCGWGGSDSRPGGWRHYNWSLLTHISYHSAVKLQSNGSLWFQPACGCVAPDCGLPAPDAEYAAIRGAARAHGVKLLLSLTELNATSFAETFLFDPAARAAASRNLAQLRLDSGANGFGFDFEGSYVTNATDATAIVSFFAQVRRADLIATTAAAAPDPLLLLFPMGAMLDPPLEAGAWNMSALAEAVDLIALMCYDFVGGWAGVAGPNAPLTGGMEITDGRPGHFHDWKGDTKAAVSYYQQFSGKIAQEKLLVGVPWYGHEWATNGAGTSRADRTMRSKQIVDSPGANDSQHRAAKYGRVWDETTQTPFYAYRKEWGGSVGWVQGFYDDEQSLALKYEFIRSVPGAGVAIWAINWGFATEPMWRTLAQSLSGLKSDDAQPALPRSRPVPVSDGYVNQLTGLPALPKPHYASNSGIGAKDLANPGRMALWGEFARIAHSLPISLMGWGASAAEMQTVIALASQHNASISGEYSPWYSSHVEAGCKPICSTCGPLPAGVCDPTVTANETQELDILRDRLGNLTSLAAAHNGQHPVKVSLVFLDGERFVYNGTSSTAWKAALTRKHNLIYDLIKSLAPQATVVQYGRGGLTRTVPDSIPIPNFHPKPFYPISAHGWPTPFYAGYYTGEEKGDCYSTYLYSLHQVDHTRQHFNATATNAINHDVSCVVPTLCLGCGDLQNFEGHSFSFNHNYSLHYSWVWGAELNQPGYGADSLRFAAWDLATHITLFPGPFGYSGKPEVGGRENPTGPPELGNNTGLDHFVSYILGAAGDRRLKNDDSQGSTSHLKTDDDGNRTDAVIAAVPPTIQLDGAALVHQRLAFQHDSPRVVRAVANLKLVADAQLLTGPFTVTNKSEPPILPPTGNVHDYLSTSSYWWPCTDTCTPAILKALKIATCSKWCAPWNNQCNWTAASDPGTPALYPCNKTTGSPWVSHSGYGNPAGSKLNRQQADGVWHAVYPLTLYWWYTQEPKYLARAAKIMRVYFLDEATKMNPNLNFAQGEPGVWDGAAGGTVDFDRLRWAIDAIVLMRTEPTRRYWTDADHTGMRAWLQTYSTWCLTSPLGQGARFLVNDIGNAMVMSLLAQGLFLGDDALSHTFATNDSKRVMNLLIDGKGRFPMEDVQNPDSFGYHTSDMIEFLSLARMAALTGTDLYNWRNAHGSTMKTTVEWLAPFCRNSSSWPYPQIHIPNPWLQRCRYIYRVAANVWQNASWEELASDPSLPADADGFFTFGLDMPSFVTLLYPSTLKNATATTTTTATALRPAIGSAIWVASQGRQAVPPEAVTMLPAHIRARSAAEQAMGRSAFGLGPQFVDGMRMAVFPAVPIISGFGPPGRTVEVVQYVIDGNIAGQIGPRTTVVDGAGRWRVSMRGIVNACRNVVPWVFRATCDGAQREVSRVEFTTWNDTLSCCCEEADAHMKTDL